MRAQQGEIRAVVGPGQCPYNCSTCSCMCKAVFEEQHRHTITISFALERISLKENASEGAAPEKANAVLSRYIGNALNNHHVREMQHHDGRNEDEVFQDAASKTAYEIYSNPGALSLSPKHVIRLEAKTYPPTKTSSATQAIDTTATGWKTNLSMSMPFPQGQRVLPASPHHWLGVPLALPPGRHNRHRHHRGRTHRRTLAKKEAAPPPPPSIPAAAPS